MAGNTPNFQFPIIFLRRKQTLYLKLISTPHHPVIITSNIQSYNSVYDFKNVRRTLASAIFFSELSWSRIYIKRLGWFAEGTTQKKQIYFRISQTEGKRNVFNRNISQINLKISLGESLHRLFSQISDTKMYSKITSKTKNKDVQNDEKALY